MHTSKRLALMLAMVLVVAAGLGPAGASPEDHNEAYFLVYGESGSAQAAGLRLVEDYGGFRLMVGPTNATANLDRDQVAYRVVDYTISLRTGDIDPDRTSDTLPDELMGEGDGLHLVQLIGPTRAEWLEEISRHGEIVGYIPNYTYVVNTTVDRLSAISDLEFVRWSDRYHPGYKIDPLVLAGAADRVAISPFGPIAPPVLDPWGIDLIDVGHRSILAAASPAALAAIADRPEVAFIEPFVEPELYNSSARSTIRSDYAHNRGVLAIDQIGAVTDTGICRYHETFSALDKIRGYIDFAGDGGVDIAPGGDGHGHGTHVAGSMLGDAPPFYAHNQQDGQGPGAHLVAVKVFTNAGWWYGGTDYYGIWESAYALKAHVNNNSWGANTAGAYTASDSEADEVTHAYRNYLLVMAAGNSGFAGPGGTGSPANAKNVLTVGALETGNPDNVAHFSSRGPTQDGRIKPDVMAPGTQIMSPQAGTTNQYVAMSGTSMASPQVAGAALLVRDYFMRGFYPGGAPNPLAEFEPTAALVKAVLINGAEEVTGLRADWNNEGRFPNTAQGWGRINVERSLRFLGDARDLRVWDSPAELVTGEVWTATVTVPYRVGDFKATLTWTDPHALPGALPAIQNDLHLVVRTPCGATFHGNNFVSLNPGYSIPGGPFDTINTVEGVHFLQWSSLPHTVPAGVWEIEVIGANIVVADPQDFALVVSYEPLVTGVVGPNAQVAVMGDYNNELAALLANAGYNVVSYGMSDYMDVINDLNFIDVVVINRAANVAGFDLLLDEVAVQQKGIIFTSSFSWRWHGIGVLSSRTGQPAQFTQLWNSRPVSMTVQNPGHPILSGYFNNGRVVLFNGGGNDSHGFNQFNGTVLGRWTSNGPLRYNIGVRDAAQTGGARHVLMAAFGVGYWQGTDHWTAHAERIFLRAVEWARGAI